MGRGGGGIGRFTKPLKTQAVSQLAQTALQSVFLLLSFVQPVLLACIKDYCTDVDVEMVVMERHLSYPGQPVMLIAMLVVVIMVRLDVRWHSLLIRGDRRLKN